MTGLENTQLIFLGLLFAAVCLAVLGVAELMKGQTTSASRRLVAPTETPSERVSLNFDEESTFFRLVVRPMRDLFKPKDEAELGTLRTRLVQAGIYSPNAVPTYYVSRVLCAAAFPLLITLFSPMLASESGSNMTGMITIASAGIGYFIPTLYLDQRVSKRQTAIRNGFPDSLDLLIICVEAGLGLDSAVVRVGEEISLAHPLLGEQYRMLGAELRAGKARDEAWRGIGRRTGVEEVKSLVTLLIQADALGTSTADALRAHAADLRIKRLLKAEEKAQQLGAKMTFPLILMILPALMIVIGTPVIIQIIRVLGPAFDNISQ